MESFIEQSINEAQQNILPQELVKMEGMTGTLTRNFYNLIVKNTPSPVYLEIGTWKGSSVCSAMYNNKATVVCIDNWSEFNGPKNEFLQNFEKYKGDNNASFIEQDCFKVDISTLPKFNIYMYDGGHTEQDHYNALVYYYDCMENTFIFIIDDWNWQQVRDGTYRAIKQLNAKVVYEKEIKTSTDNSTTMLSDTWWNGMAIFVLSK